MSTNVLVYNNAELKLFITVDASPVGVGAVWLHIMSEWSEKKIYFASRTLSRGKRNCAQIEQEGLAVIFGVSKFHKYIYGREFTIITDHKLLLGLLEKDHAISPTVRTREKRWPLVLANYRYQLVYKPCSNISSADGLSRLPVENYFTPLLSMEKGVPSMSALNSTPVTSETVSFTHQAIECYPKCVNGSYRDCPSKDLLTFNDTQPGKMSYRNNWVEFLLWEPYPSYHNGLFSLLLVLRDQYWCYPNSTRLLTFSM